MRVPARPHTGRAMRTVSTFALYFLMTASIALGQTHPLSEDQILDLLFRKVAGQAQIAELVNNNGVDFRISDAKRSHLRKHKAGPELLAAVEAAARDYVKRLDGPWALIPPLPEPVRQLPPFDAQGRKALLERARSVALTYASGMQSFTCMQVEKRTADMVGDGSWRPVGEIVARVFYQHGKTERRVASVNNDIIARVDDRLPYLIFPELEQSNLAVAASNAIWERGIPLIGLFLGFGYQKPNKYWTVKPYKFAGQTPTPADFLSALRDLFVPERETEFAWMRQGWLRRTPVEIYTYEVPDLMSSWQVADGYGESHEVAYGGRVYVERNTGRVLRITRQAVDLPVGWTVTAAEMVLDFDYLGAAGQERLLPWRAGTLVIQDHPSGSAPSAGVITKAQTDFRGYKFYTVDSTITYEAK